MRKSILAIASFALALASTAHTGETNVRTYQLPEGRLLKLVVPLAWQDQSQLPPGRPFPAIRFRKTGDDFVADLNVQVLSPPGVETNLAQIRGIVEGQARRLALQVGADSVELIPIDGPQVSGYYFSLSEAMRKPGEYQHLTTGVVAIGAATTFFEILTNDGAEAAVADMLAMVTTAALSSPPVTVPQQDGKASAEIRPADAGETRLLHGQVGRLMDFYWDDEADSSQTVEATYPRAIAAAGGADAVRAAVMGMRQQMRDLGMSRETSDFPSPPTIIKTAHRTYAIVPTHLIARAGDKRVESYNYQFGILEPGSLDWTFLEGSRVNEEMLREWFPDFPTDYSLPRVSRELVEGPALPEG